MLELLVCGGAGDEQSKAVACGKSSDDAAASDRCVHHREPSHIPKLALKNTVESFGATHGHQAVLIRQLGKDANLIAVLELTADCHDE